MNLSKNLLHMRKELIGQNVLISLLLFYVSVQHLSFSIFQEKCHLFNTKNFSLRINTGDFLEQRSIQMEMLS